MTVRENVQMALLSYHRRLKNLWVRASMQYIGEANALLARVGMEEQAERPCSVLAYGDLKRLELAVALANRPKLLLMDEPTAGMAAQERIALMALAARLSRATRHQPFHRARHGRGIPHANRMIVLDRGS